MAQELTWFGSPYEILRHFVLLVSEQSHAAFHRYKKWFILLVFVILPYPFLKFIDGPHAQVYYLVIPDNSYI